MMTEETTAQCYRGVVCRRCRQPIPLPGIVERLSRGDEESSSGERTIRSFHLRCRVCECEKTYHTGDIAEFEGTPRTRSRAHGSLFGSPGQVARGAHG